MLIGHTNKTYVHRGGGCCQENGLHKVDGISPHAENRQPRALSSPHTSLFHTPPCPRLAAPGGASKSDQY